MTNALGAMDMGLLPDFYPGGVAMADREEIKKQWGESAPTANGLTSLEMIARAEAGELKALLVHRSNPVVDLPGGDRVENALRKLDLLVVHDMLETETTELAHLVLPSNGPGYDEGTTTNIGGRVQIRKSGLEAEHAPDWKIISLMLNTLGDETSYQKSLDVTDEIAKNIPGYQGINRRSMGKSGCNREPIDSNDETIAKQSTGVENDGNFQLRIATFLFAHDKILDASSKLAHHFLPFTAYLNEEDAKRLAIKNGDTVLLSSEDVSLEAIANVNNRCQPGGVVVPRISDLQKVNAFFGTDGAPASVKIRKV